MSPRTEQVDKKRKAKELEPKAAPKPKPKKPTPAAKPAPAPLEAPRYPARSSAALARTKENAKLPFFPTIDLYTGEPCKVPDQWGEARGGVEAAQGLPDGNVGRLLGTCQFVLGGVDAEMAEELQKKFDVATSFVGKLPKWGYLKYWNNDGEFFSKDGEHIPVTRLVDLLNSSDDVTTYNRSKADSIQLLEMIYALQNPQSSPWKRPMLRAFSIHPAKLSKKAVSSQAKPFTVTYYVYAGRLLFELVADPSVHILMQYLEPAGKVTPARVEKPQTIVYDKTDWQGDCEFSLASLLRHAENQGYAVKDRQPQDLTVQLFEYQRSTYQWMLDRERVLPTAGGLNGFFWEKRQWADEGAVWYFPLAGEFRLEEPPATSGGLLCEEMGLGKTVEVLSIVLGNKPPPRKAKMKEGELLQAAGTCVITPVSLVHQWMEESHTRVRKGALGIVTYTGGLFITRHVPMNEIELQGKLLKGNLYNLLRSSDSNASPEFYSKAACESAFVDWTPIKKTEEQDEEEEEEPKRSWFGRLTSRSASSTSTGTGGGSSASTGTGGGSSSSSGGGTSSSSSSSVAQSAALPLKNGKKYPAKLTLTRSEFLRAKKAAEDGEETELIPIHYSIDELLEDADLVLSTYEALRTHSRFFVNKSWHRMVLDECQEIKTATTAIAQMCRRVEARHRWMVSGTPISNSIDDFHGELAFLNVWPFCLQNDGFWEKKISLPFAQKDPAALPLLHALISTTIMRHSKFQTYLNGEPLLKLPGRTIEFIAVDLESEGPGSNGGNNRLSSARYVYCYIELLCRSVCEQIAASTDGSPGRRDFLRLKGLLSLLLKATTHTTNVNLQGLDTLRRSVMVQQAGNPHAQYFQNVLAPAPHGHVMGEAPAPPSTKIATLSPRDIMQRVQQLGSGRAGGLNRDVARQWAVGGEKERKEREKLEALPIAEIRRLIALYELPQPMAWAYLKYHAGIDRGSKTLNFLSAPANAKSSEGGSSTDTGSSKDTSAKYVKRTLKEGDVLRIHSNHEDNEANVSNVIEADEDGEDVSTGVVALKEPWSCGNVKDAKVWLHASATRKQPYVELLLARENEQAGRGANGVVTAGFDALFKMLAGESIQCAVCLEAITQPCVTSCVHVYCKKCIGQEMDVAQAQFVSAKCPLCRRPVLPTNVFEMSLHSSEETAEDLEAANAAEISNTFDLMDDSNEDGSSTSGCKGKGKQKNNDGGGSSTSNGYGGHEEGGSSGNNRHARGSSSGGGGGSSSGTGGSSMRDSTRQSRRHNAANNYDGGGSSQSGVNGADDDVEMVDAPALHNGVDVHLPDFSAIEPPLSSAVLRQKLRATPVPAGVQLLRDNHLPSLEPAFLAHWRAAAACVVSAKLKVLLDDMERVSETEPASKFVVFSAFPPALESLARALTSRDLGHVSVSGAASADMRGAAVAKFNADSTIRVLLLTTGSAASGLSLTAASTVYMLEPAFSAMDEAQALSRCHRIGQTHAVRCVILYCPRTLEERLLALRHELGSLAVWYQHQGALTGVEEGPGGTAHLLSMANTRRLLGLQ